METGTEGAECPAQVKWLFLPKHKLELMFSAIEHYAPRRRHLAGNLFPALRTTNTFSCPPLFLPANEKMVSTCSQTASQSALHSLLLFTLEIPVDLHLQFSQAAGLKRLFLCRTNFASYFRRLREQTNSRTFPAKSFGCVLYSVSFLVQSKENSREKPGREINLKDTSDGANHAVTTGSNGSFNCLLSRPVLK